MQTLTHSRLACFRACPRRHWMRYELGLTPDEQDWKLRVGSAFHAALDAISKGLEPDDAVEHSLESPYDMGMVAAMVVQHQERWAGREPMVVASELEFEMLLRNPETGAPTSTWKMAGVIDKVVELPDGRLALMEHKTTSLDFSPGADYWVRLHMDMQLSIYVLAARAAGFDVATILYDVTRRPMLRPKMATPEDKRKYKANGELYANQRDTDEAPEEFAKRVSEDMAERPDHYFARIEIARLEDDLEECAAELWQQQKSIRAAQRMGRWYRNPGACFQPFPCSYLPICQNKDLEDTTPTGFTRSADVHSELTTQGVSSACQAGASRQEEATS